MYCRKYKRGTIRLGVKSNNISIFPRCLGNIFNCVSEIQRPLRLHEMMSWSDTCPTPTEILNCIFIAFPAEFISILFKLFRECSVGNCLLYWPYQHHVRKEDHIPYIFSTLFICARSHYSQVCTGSSMISKLYSFQKNSLLLFLGNYGQDFISLNLSLLKFTFLA